MFRALYPAKRRTREKENRGDFLIFVEKETYRYYIIFFFDDLNRVRLESDRGLSAEENIFVPEMEL